MANSKYEYVKSFEMDDEVMLPNIIIVHVDGRDFRRFSEAHQYEKPNDIKGLELMNECAKAVLEQFPDIIFSYGHSDEYSFIFKKETVLSEACQDLRYAPSFRSRVIPCATMEVLQAYLLWRQYECHLNNQQDTCFWQLIKSGKSGKEAEEMLKGCQKQERNELLYQLFNVNYKKDIPEIFRQGTCALKTEVEDIVKYKDDGCPVKRLRKKIIMVRSENIASRRFWNDHLCLLKELGQFTEDLNKCKPDYLRSFLYESRLMACTWIVIRIDGCHFHRFSDVHEFEKPNDVQALNLMNSCASGVFEEFKYIVFAYGVSDEYSFVLRKEAQLYGRHVSDIVTAVVSFFSSMYILRWSEFFAHKELKFLPHFDGRAVCYPSCEILRDYLAWRQVDCHINNQYNTCFWMLLKSGKSKSEAQNSLKGTQAQEKIELLDKLSGIGNYYNTMSPIFRQGSSVYWDKETKLVENEEGATGKTRKIVVIKHCNIIETNFWAEHPEILEEKKQWI